MISRCNQIKVEVILRGEADLTWCPNMYGQPSFDDSNFRGKIVCPNQKNVDFWTKWIQIASHKIGEIPLKAWTRDEYMSSRCLIPINSCICVNVEDLIKTSLIIHGVTQFDGMLCCRTTYAINSSQCICNIEVTEKLSELIERCNRTLSGSAGPLTFRLRSEDDEDAAIEEVLQIKHEIPAKNVIPTTAVEALLDDGSAGGRDGDDMYVDTASAATADLLNSSCPNTLTLSPMGSDNVTKALTNKFEKMGRPDPDPLHIGRISKDKMN